MSLLEKKGYNVTYNKLLYDDVLPTRDEFELFVKELNLPFVPYDFQMNAAFESICNYRQINKMATSSGKSLVQYMIIRYLLSKNYKIVMLVPRVMLVEQMYSDFKSYGWNDIDSFLTKIGGDNTIKHFESDITLSTWQSIQASPSLFSNIDALIIDEVHGAGGAGVKDKESTQSMNVYEKIVFKASTGARWRLGFTGTIPDDAVAKMILIGSVGEVKTYITPRQLIDRGLATNVLVKFLFFNYSIEDKKIVRKFKYPDEVNFFNNHDNRNTTLSKIINKVSTEGNTIVLVDSIEYGEILASNILKIRGIDIETKLLKKADNEYKIYIINGSTKGIEREKIRLLLEKENNCILIGTSSILSTGVNIKNLHNLFLTSGGKSFVQINQAIGRLLRMHVSKILVKIWDIVDDCSTKGKSSTSKNYRYKQWEERMIIYNENEYEYTEKEINIS
jgi:superfamily II DNA or RNA helicase